MKKIYIAAVTFFASAIMIQQSFSDQTPSVVVDPASVRTQFRALDSNVYMMSIKHTSDHSQIEKCGKPSVNADNRPVAFDSSYTQGFESGSVIESYDLTLSEKQAVRLAQALRVDYELCGQTMQVAYDDIAKLKKAIISVGGRY